VCSKVSGGIFTSMKVKFSLSPGWNFPVALYFSMVTLTTVGLGDFYPVTRAGVILLMFFSIVGLGIVAMTISVIRCDVKDMWEERVMG
jgi:voltage-gated potassium channel